MLYRNAGAYFNNHKLEGTNHVEILSGQDIVHTILDIKRIGQALATRGFGLFNGNGRLGQTAFAFSAWVLWLDAKLWELWVRDFVEESGLMWTDLPFIAKLGKIIENSGPIPTQGLSSLIVSKKTNGVAK